MREQISKDQISNSPGHRKTGSNAAAAAAVVDEDGFQLVQNKKRRPSDRIIGSRKSSGDGVMKSAPKIVDLYVGNVNLGVTEEIVTRYVKDETDVSINKCTALKTRNPNYTSFKISVSLKDRDTLLSPDVWPEGVICRKFRSPRSFNS